ncbi:MULTISPECIES: antibiotic biosynthesis monooxygenase [Microbacterium]|uniref:Antibiotic biosynthesis monooxygenase n=1 Tax=Microbacterium wangchenii TaxID=2541726 RepID=A0ABX5SQG9_9MICO|nr:MULTISPECIES: antibiotic biosynthesis monooxygenase [Microbacterium]MCK6064912.1 antibiotic biosynthesis monooxygenase [Microbacterium sp. EYE_512]QBR88395.1 antibiotic biosynthesis monooxygenase [Microbacterium wangchenii]TFV82554.1 antibiotic biosynthesis monooxygenase [Microbacterium sp. dk485]TXK20122.1 antibiotic biosynthesis monooxygenase [Microbacterium wangchenii]
MSQPVTFVNVIEVEPSNQQELIDLLIEGTEKVISTRQGFISVTLLASLDRTRVINIAVWESAEDVKATQSDPAAVEYARRTAAIARPGPGRYAVAAEFTA